MRNAEPLYEKVKHHITDGILSGSYRPGAKLPSEHELVEKLSVSRMTVSRALRELTRDGIIYRMQGIGSFVSEANSNTSLSEVRDIRDIIAERGGTHSCEVLAAEAQPLTAHHAALLDLNEGELALCLKILNFENGVPLQYEHRYVRHDFAPALLELDFENRSIAEYLQNIAPISELEHLVEAALPDEEEATLLRIEQTVPILRVRRRTWVGSRVVTLGYFIHPGDRYRVAVRMRPSDFRAPMTPL